MSFFAPDERLSSAAEFVRQGAVLADIGTDHAYLPLFLLASGKISFAYCCDIGEGPLATAKANAALTPFSDRMEFRLTDGLCGLENTDTTDFTVCGMGGELIASILRRAPWIKNPKYRLVLQPMSRHAFLRTYLAENGFTIGAERFSFADGKYYVCLCASYTGKCGSLPALQAEFGHSPDVSNPAFLGYLNNRVRALKKAALGKATGGRDISEETALLREIETIFAKEILP